MDRERLLAIHDEVCSDAKRIMDRKNHDYSGGGGPFDNFRGASALGVDPKLGLLLRVMDKLMRVKTFIAKGELKVQGEGVDDAIKDVVNYMVLLKGMIEEDTNVQR